MAIIEKHPQRKQTEIFSHITPILITGNTRLTPYIQIFTHQPENISQHTLGTLFGVFKIDDVSVDSAFIVNFLVSELKKEYYGNPRRTPAGSFEAGLNRINIALSELAKQGNISWIGKLESTICALEKNGMMHFSVTGPSHIALLREGTLSLISDGLAPDPSTPNPLKTFLEISSGKLHPKDLVILGTHELFEFLPVEKMEVNARRFTDEEFTRFLHTALVNEFDFCGAMTVSLNQKNVRPKANTQKSSSAVTPESIPNLWGENETFQKHPPKKSTTDDTSDTTHVDEISSKNRDGHIYIEQDPNSITASRQEFKETLLILKERLANASDEYFSLLHTTLRQWNHTIAKKISKKIHRTTSVAPPLKKKLAPPTDDPIITHAHPSENTPKASQPMKFDIPLREDHLQQKEEIVASPKKSTLLGKNKIGALATDMLPTPPKRLKQPQSETGKNTLAKTPHTTPVSFEKDWHEYAKEIKNRLTCTLSDTRKSLHLIEGFTWLKKNIILLFGFFWKSTRKCLSFFQFRILDGFQFLKKILPTLSLRGKIIFLGAFIFLLLVAIFFYTSKTKTSEEIPPSPAEETSPTEEVSPFSKEKNVSLTQKENLITLYSSQNTVQDIFPISSDSLIVVEEDAIVILPLNEPFQSFPLPEKNGKILSATYMNDLSLLFLLTDTGSILSFSPVSQQFSNNTISLPDIDSNMLIGSYLTYLYMVNTKENTILRYPRIEGGFGPASEWLPGDSGIPLNGVQAIAIDGSLYLLKTDGILRLSNKKKDPLTLENTNIPIQFGSIFTQDSTETILLSDTSNNRILFFTKEGTIKKQIILPPETSQLSHAILLQDDSRLILQTGNEIVRLEE